MAAFRAGQRPVPKREARVLQRTRALRGIDIGQVEDGDLSVEHLPGVMVGELEIHDRARQTPELGRQDSDQLLGDIHRLPGFTEVAVGINDADRLQGPEDPQPNDCHQKPLGGVERPGPLTDERPSDEHGAHQHADDLECDDRSDEGGRLDVLVHTDEPLDRPLVDQQADENEQVTDSAVVRAGGRGSLTHLRSF